MIQPISRALVVASPLFLPLVLLAAQTPLPAPAGPSPVIAPGAEVQKIAGDLGFVEGPTVDRDGNVYFSDQPNNRIMKYDVDGHLTTFMQPAGRTNGMTFDETGHNLLMAADEKNELWSVDVATKKVTVLVNGYDGKLLNGPNDIWVQPTTGRIYFTDPYYQRDYWTRGPKENAECVYLYTRGDKTLVRVVDDLMQPNGIIGPADGKHVYIADIRGRAAYRYDISADGTLANKTKICDTGSDGMTIDSEGNIYLSSRTVQVFDPNTGQRIENITVPESPANLVFGGRDRQTLFITARTGFYALKMKVKGVGPQ
jgi:gluconolactonase